MAQRKQPLPGNAIRAAKDTLAAGSCGRIAVDEVVRVPGVCDENDARFLVKLQLATWQDVDSSFPERAIVNDDGHIVQDMTGLGPLERAAVERQVAIDRNAPHKVPAVEIGDTEVENRDGDVSVQKRGAKRQRATA